MHLFYATDIGNNVAELSETESGHCARVLRMQAGEIIELTDGKGYFYKAELTLVHPKRCCAKIVETLKVEPIRNCILHMAVAPLKYTDRFEFFIEKAVEIGVDCITLLKTRFSERKETKTERIEKIILSGVKQSRKAFIPALKETTLFKEFINLDFQGQKFIAHCYPGEKKTLKNAMEKGSNVLILIGPEGDFSEEEVLEAQKKGFVEVSLSESRLRTETAALVAVATFDFINQK